MNYSLAIELGGFNTFVAMLVALEQTIPLVDSDCCARAVPALETLLFSVNGNTICPIGMADADGNKLIIDLADPKDAAKVEQIARQITVDFGSIAGISGWLIQKQAIVDTLPAGSISLYEKIGRILRDQTIPYTDKWARIAQVMPPPLQCKQLYTERISGGITEAKDGFDIGYIEFGSTISKAYITYFQNETLVIGKPGAALPTMTAPDIIAMFNAKTGEPLTNTDLFDKNGKVIHLDVSIGLIQVDNKWWNPGIDKLDALWGPHLSAAYPGYTGGIVPYQ